MKVWIVDINEERFIVIGGSYEHLLDRFPDSPFYVEEIIQPTVFELGVLED